MVSFLWMWCGHALVIFFGAWALWRGDKPLRLGAAFILIAWFLTPLVQTRGLVGLDIGTTSVDIALLVGLTWLSLTYRQLWALLASSSQLLCVTGHFAAALSSHVGMFTYVTGNGFWGGYMLVLALAIGVIGNERHLKDKSAQ
jgi:hypothetical protein